MKSKNSFTMNIKSTSQHLLVMLAMACGITACKKDKPVDPTPTPVEVVAITVQDLKSLAKDAAVTVPEGRKISGIVISNVDEKNIASASLIVQEETGKPGIVVNLSAANTSFKSGDKVEINISKQKLEKVNGEIVLTSIPLANVTKTSTGTIMPKETTVQELSANAAAWDGTLVKLPAGRFYGGDGRYVAGIEYADASGRVKAGVLDGATFKGQAYAASVSQLVGIVRVEGTVARIDIRNTSDVTGGEITRLLVEDFSDVNYFIQHPDYNSEIIQSGFTTAKEEWSNAVNACFLLKGDRFDGSFLSANRKYLYLVNGPRKSDGLNLSNSLQSSFQNLKLKGLKTITVTFAGSKMVGTDILKSNADGAPSTSVAAFDQSVDYFQLGVWFQLSSRNGFQLNSAKFTKTGEWITATFTLPTKAEMLAMGLPRVTEENIDAFLENPTAIFYNLSIRTNDQNNRDDEGIRKFAAPIVFDRIEFGLTN